MTDIQYHNFKSIQLEENCDETDYIRNSIPNFDEIGDIIRGPIQIIERMAMAGLLSKHPEGETDPCDVTALDIQLIHKLAAQTTMEIEGIVKTYKHHGKNACLSGNVQIHKVNKKTGATEKITSITALENLIQAATIGMYVEAAANIQAQGNEGRVDLYNSISDEKVETIQEMRNAIGADEVTKEALREFMQKYAEKLEIERVFSGPKQLAVAMSAHYAGHIDFYKSYEDAVHTTLGRDDRVPEVDRNIMIEKAKNDKGLQELLNRLRESYT